MGEVEVDVRFVEGYAGWFVSEHGSDGFMWMAILGGVDRVYTVSW